MISKILSTATGAVAPGVVDGVSVLEGDGVSVLEGDGVSVLEGDGVSVLAGEGATDGESGPDGGPAVVAGAARGPVVTGRELAGAAVQPVMITSDPARARARAPRRADIRRARPTVDSDITETQHLLGRGAEQLVGPGVGKPLEPVLGVVDPVGAEALLELRQGPRLPGLAEMVGQAAFGAGELQHAPLDQGAGLGGADPVDVHGAPGHVGGLAQQHD